jgi:hypothetical protein
MRIADQLQLDLITSEKCMEVVDTMKDMELSAHGIAAPVFDDCCHIACDFIKTCFEHVPMEAKVARKPAPLLLSGLFCFTIPVR